MGNKLTRRRPIVDERYTQPQGLYEHDDVNHRKLRRLILNGQLAPCYPGAEELAIELDECPICFLFYPSLNRSKCCSKGICTECFLQIKSPHTPRSVQCPFCKMPNYAVEYRGAKTVEEKGVEQAEEQRVIEAKIRIRHQELLEEEQRMLRREEDRHEGSAGQDQLEDVSLSGGDAPDARARTTSDVETARQSHTAQTNGPYVRFNREDDFDMDLEDIMLMEAIWLSVQEPGLPNQDSLPTASGILGTMGTLGNEMHHNQSVDNDSSTLNQAQTLGATRSGLGRRSIRGGLAGAIAALAERQVISNESQSGQPICSQIEGEQNVMIANRHSRSCGSTESLRDGGEVSSISSGPHSQSSAHVGEEQRLEKGAVGDVGHELNNWIEVSVESGRATSLSLTRGESRGSMSDWVLDQSSEAVEVGTSFSSSVPSTSELPWEAPELHVAEPPLLSSSIQMLPESFEEQMMLAMALSLAEAQAQSRQHCK